MTEDKAAEGNGASWLRHTLATLAYRAEKVLRDAPKDFVSFKASAASRTPLAIVAHMGDLLEWGERMAGGEMRWQPVPQQDWTAACDRFFGALARLDAAVAANGVSNRSLAIIFQGPVADALSHVGQLALLRGMCGVPVRPESYARATIIIGEVGRSQSTARTEFDDDASPQAPR
jgi:hypothetical protein